MSQYLKKLFQSVLVRKSNLKFCTKRSDTKSSDICHCDFKCEEGNQLSWINKTQPEPMMEVFLVLSVRHLHDGQHHLFTDSKISGFKKSRRKELIFGDNEIVGMLKFSSLAEKQKH